MSQGAETPAPALAAFQLALGRMIHAAQLGAALPEDVADDLLATLRSSGHETDLLHDRIIKARAVKQELEVLIARAPARPSDSRIETREDERRAAARAGDVRPARPARRAAAARAYRACR